MRRIMMDTFKFFLITAIAGLLLGGVYVITKEPIAQAKAAAQQAAYRTVFAEGAEFAELEFDNENAQKILADNGYTDETIDGIVEAKDASGNTVGYVLTVTTSAGFGGNITISVGIKNDGTVNGYAVLSMSETAGLGAKAKEEKFSSQFVNKLVEKFTVTKTGATADNEIDAITSATITSKAVTGAVNAGLCYMQEELMEEGGESNE